MKRIGKRAIIVSAGEMQRFGWTYRQQVVYNPAAKQVLAQDRALECGRRRRQRTNTWVNRFAGSRDPAALQHALWCRSRES